MSTIKTGEMVQLLRDVDGFLIPSGTPILLCKDEPVVVTQALGGSYTINVQGNLVRLMAKDADAIGASIEEANTSKTFDGGVVETTAIWEQLRTCYDPEIPVNIADLGLIYKVDVTAHPEQGYIVAIDMTLTAPGCGMGPILVQEVYEKVNLMANVAEVKVELVFDPPWEQHMMSEAAQLQLGLL